MRNTFRSRLQQAKIALLGGGVAAFLILTMRFLGALQELELAHYDAKVWWHASASAAPDVVIVAVDDADIETFGWPVPDAVLARAIRRLGELGARTVGVDIYRDQPVPPGTDELAREIATPGVIWVTKLPSSNGQVVPPPPLALETGRHGFSDMPLDGDGTVRRALLLVNDGSQLRLGLALRLAIEALGPGSLAADREDPGVLRLGTVSIPRVTGDFAGYSGADAAGYQTLFRFDHALPVAPVLTLAELFTASGARETVEGRNVLIGTMSETVKDHFRTPLNFGGDLPHTFGVQLHASLVQQLLDFHAGRAWPIRAPPIWVSSMLIAGAAFLGAGLATRARRMPTLVLAGPVAAIAIVAAMSPTPGQSIWLPAVPTGVAWFSGFLLSALGLGVAARRQRRSLEQLFAAHLSPELAAEIWRNRDLILSGGRPRPMRLQATVLFADLAGATVAGGRLSPEKFADWIGTFVDRMARVAATHGGFVEKYTGDGIMVVFGAPLPDRDEAARRGSARRACTCALDMLKATDELNAALPDTETYRLRIGIHSGPVIGGTFGGLGARQYVILGDTANIAARIEAFCKTCDPPFGIACISAETLALAAPFVKVEPSGTMPHDDETRSFEISVLRGVPAWRHLPRAEVPAMVAGLRGAGSGLCRNGGRASRQDRGPDAARED